MEHNKFVFTSGAGASKKMKINEVADISVSGSEHSDKPDLIVPNDKASMSRDVSNHLTISSVNANIS
jgi:fumarate hydratase class II